MHEVLIALQNNLASRIALRYAKQLEAVHRFNLQAIHIPEIRGTGPAPGSGWVKEKWEDAMTRESREEVSDLISREYLFHFSDSPLKTASGPEDQVILGELEDRPYDFFIEGRLHAFEPEAFTERISSRLYRDMVCPVLMVKNLPDPDRGTLVLSGPGICRPSPRPGCPACSPACPHPRICCPVSLNPGISEQPRQRPGSPRLRCPVPRPGRASTVPFPAGEPRRIWRNGPGNMPLWSPRFPILKAPWP